LNTQAEVVSLLKPLGLRLTPQRLAIAEVIINSADHPTVKNVFERVKEFFPYVTLATVYSTLTTLCEAGVVHELAFQRQSRYDANITPHANLVCISCGSVIDADVGQNTVGELRDIISSSSSFTVASQRVDFYGLCEGCCRNTPIN
jgi:Fur family peroxide stress response transcriptional regulator